MKLPWRILVVFAVCLLAIPAVSAAKPPAPFAPGSRVTFYGDSITTHNYFTYQIEFIETLRHPENPMLTISRGRAGDTARGGFARWDWDAAPVPSDRVVVMFGMNDVGRDNWKAAEPDAATAAKRASSLATYEEYMRKLADKILASGRKLTLVTPSPFDQYAPAEPPANIPFCNDPGLATCAKMVRRLADEKNVEVLDYYGPLTKFLQEHPEFGLLAKDRVHPDGRGGLLMAVLALQQAGELPFVDETELDAKGTAAATFAYAPKHLPYPRTDEYRSVHASYPLDGKLTREIVRIVNLPTGTYELVGEGTVFGTFSAAELAAGVDFALLETPSMRQARNAAKLFAARRAFMQMSRRLVSVRVCLHAMGVDEADATAVEAALQKEESEREKRFGGGKNPKLYKYYMGQLAFYRENQSKASAFDAENDRLHAELVKGCQPKAWRLEVRGKR